jgi:hypothetical protein
VAAILRKNFGMKGNGLQASRVGLMWSSADF